MGHNLKWFLVNSNQWCCHGNAFVKERLAKIYRFSRQMAFFSLRSYLYRSFLVQMPDQSPKIDPCAKFQPNWKKGKGSRILT